MTTTVLRAIVNLLASDLARLARSLWHPLVRPERAPRDCSQLDPGQLPPAPRDVAS